MQEIISSIPVLSGIVEKGGVVGVLLIILVFLIWNTRRLMRELNRVYRQRDFCRQVRARYKYALDGASITVRIDDIEAEMKDDDHMDKE